MSAPSTSPSARTTSPRLCILIRVWDKDLVGQTLEPGCISYSCLQLEQALIMGVILVFLFATIQTDLRCRDRIGA